MHVLVQNLFSPFLRITLLNGNFFQSYRRLDALSSLVATGLNRNCFCTDNKLILIVKKLVRLIDDLKSKMEYAAVSNLKISGAPVAWHIDHALLVINAITHSIEKSNPSEYSSKRSFGKWYVFTFHKIPRGRAQSPKAVRPDQNFTTEDINRHFEICYTSLEKLNHLDRDKFFTHPYFGHLNLKSSIKFIEIHTKHHLSIINDILKA